MGRPHVRAARRSEASARNLAGRLPDVIETYRRDAVPAGSAIVLPRTVHPCTAILGSRVQRRPSSRRRFTVGDLYNCTSGSFIVRPQEGSDQPRRGEDQRRESRTSSCSILRCRTWPACTCPIGRWARGCARMSSLRRSQNWLQAARGRERVPGVDVRKSLQEDAGRNDREQTRGRARPVTRRIGLRKRPGRARAP